MNIILVRHGKAKDKTNVYDDQARPLTSKGKKQIRHITPVVKDYAENKVIIWSSPVLRAAESAQIISKIINAKVQYHDFLICGNYTEFIQSLEGLSDDTTVIVVGHEPYLGEWSLDLCGKRLLFKKGGAAVFKIQSGETELKLLVQDYNIGNRLNPIIIMGEYLDEIAYREEAFLKDQKDLENVHQIRVKLRQIRSLLSFIKPLLQNEEYLKYQTVLRNVTRRFSRLRQLDVLYEAWSEIIRNNEGLLLQYSDLITALDMERELEKSAVRKYISEMLMGDELKDAAIWIRSLDLDMEHFREFEKHRLEAWRKKTDIMHKDVDFNNIHEVHRLRIRYKKLRYAESSLELSKHKELEKIQDELGKICDAQLNNSLLKEINNKYELPGLKYESGMLIGYQLSEQKISREYLKDIM